MTAAPPLGTGTAVDVELSEVTVRFTTRRARTVSVKVPLRVKTRMPNSTMNGSE